MGKKPTYPYAVLYENIEGRWGIAQTRASSSTEAKRKASKFPLFKRATQAKRGIVTGRGWKPLKRK